MKKKIREFIVLFAAICILFTFAIDRISVGAAEIQAATMMEALDRVNVRVLPNTEAEVLGQLEQGDRLFAVELTEEGWYRVVYEGETGYVRSDFLKIYGVEEWDAPENPDATGFAGEIVDPEEEIRKASEEAAARESESIERASLEAASAAAASEARVQEEAARKKRSRGINIVILTGAVLLIAVYGVYTVIKEGKAVEETPQDSLPEKDENNAEESERDAFTEPLAEEQTESQEDEIEYLDLE